MLIVVHTLKPNSLTHSLQIHCTQLTSLRSHTFWAWTKKRDPTIEKLIFLQAGKGYNVTFFKNNNNNYI